MRVVETYDIDINCHPDRALKLVATFKTGRCSSHTMRACGKGKPWSTTQPLGFWRDFVDLDLDDAEAVIALIKRRGDPLGHIDGKNGETESGLWFGLCGHLRNMAEGWEAEDANRVSHLTDDPGRLNHVTQWWRHFALPHYANEISLTVDPQGSTLPALLPKTLGAYMILSAGSAFARRSPMRRCDHCHSWFELKRSDARFCTASCRAMSAAK
ncbi:hypothetical protein GCM10007857_76650 [Bradyrhizobium iriomotense]|uniref:Zinc finger CGNR domain-containing protein n=1 Tax=Bradyrhizobium iriomotense TaxID=441950 RepID=A0ABQ6BC04_9BRAD|nr:hypothetical protein GCM10007857_76650 [Bradyrhizobium iriomotense]